MTNQPEFTVLLDQGERTHNKGYSSGYTLRGASFFRTDEDDLGVTDSVAAVQEAKLFQAPTYFIANGRKFADKDKKEPTDPVWVEWHNGLGERLTLQAEKGYSGIPNGLQIVDIQGAGLFMPRPEEIRAVIEGKDPSRKLKNYAYPIIQAEKDLLLGEKQAYRWDGTELKVVPVTFFPSYEAFAEEAKTPEFKRSLKDMKAVYAVVRSVEEARKNPSGYRPTKEQLTNPDLAIPLGGEDQVKAIFLDSEGNVRFGYKQIGSHHEGYKNIDSGRVALLGIHDVGVVCGNLLNSYGGRSVGVAPEALVARVEEGIFKQPSLDEIVEVVRSGLQRSGLQ